MKIKHFSIRLNKEQLTQDETALNDFLETVEVKQTNMQVVTNGAVSYWSVLVGYEAMPQEEQPIKASAEPKPSFNMDDLTEEEHSRYQSLRLWRNTLAKELFFMPYMIATNSQLGQIAQMNPTDENQLEEIKGFGSWRMAKFGEDIIRVLDGLR